MKKTKVAVIGCGTIANNAHIPSYLKNPDVDIPVATFSALLDADHLTPSL